MSLCFSVVFVLFCLCLSLHLALFRLVFLYQCLFWYLPSLYLSPTLVVFGLLSCFCLVCCQSLHLCLWCFCSLSLLVADGLILSRNGSRNISPATPTTHRPTKSSFRPLPSSPDQKKPEIRNCQLFFWSPDRFEAYSDQNWNFCPDPPKKNKKRRPKKNQRPKNIFPTKKTSPK